MFILHAGCAKQTEISEESCLQATEDVTYLWLRRFGHLGYTGLILLKTKDMVPGLPELPDSHKIRTDCFQGKQHRDTMVKERLELIHAYIRTPKSNGGKR